MISDISPSKFLLRVKLSTAAASVAPGSLTKRQVPHPTPTWSSAKLVHHTQHFVAMPLTILTDSDVRSLLHQLSKQDILDLQQSLADGLHYYSTATEEDSNACCSSYQPMRTALKRNDGQTTLFMPASSNDGIGFKVVTLSTPDQKAASDTSSIASSLKATSLTESTQSSGSYEPPQSLASSQSTTPKGTLQLLDKDGSPRAFVNAEEITAFRTALASTMLFKKRQNVHDIVVFGAGTSQPGHF